MMAVDLFGDPIEPAAKKKPKAKAKTDGATVRLMALYQDEHKKRHGCAPILGTTYAHAMRIFKELKEQFGSEEAVATVIVEFFATRDPRISSGGYTVKDLNFHAPRLRLQLNGAQRPTDPTMEHNLREVSRAIRGRK